MDVISERGQNITPIDLFPVPIGLFNAGEQARKAIRSRLSKIYGCEKDLIQLHPSGMAALTTALEALKKLKPKRNQAFAPLTHKFH